MRSKVRGIGPGSSKSTAVVSTSPLITSTGWPVREQISQLSRLPGFSNVCNAFENHLVRNPRVTAAIVSMLVGPPTSTGAPRGTAMHTEVGRLTGKPQLDTIDVVRAAEEPPILTVLLPVTIVPLLSGRSFGANAVPGGVGMCCSPCTSVP